MTKNLRRWLLLGTLVAIVPLVLAACGDDDDDDDGGNDPVPTSTTAPDNSDEPTATSEPEDEGDDDQTTSWEGTTLNFGILPSEDQQTARENNEVLAAFLEEQLPGLDVTIFVGPAYAAVIESMKSDDVDFAYFGPFSYFIARQTGAGAVAAIAFSNPGGAEPGYYSVFYARNDTGITSLEDLAGREGDFDYAFVDPGSTSGNLAPHAMLYEAGLDVATIDANSRFAGGHDKTAIATGDGQIQVAPSYEEMIYEQCELGTIPGVKDLVGGGQFPGDCGDPDADGALVLLQKFLLPASPISYRDDMDPELREAVVNAILDWPSLDRESFERWAEASDSGQDGVVMVPYGPENYTQIEEMCSREELKDICPTG